MAEFEEGFSRPRARGVYFYFYRDIYTGTVLVLVQQSYLK